MKTTYKFKIGQKVQTIDEEDGETVVYGEVTDTNRDAVIIQWEDLGSPTEHPESEYHKIQLRR